MKTARLSFVMGLGLALGASGWAQMHKVAPKPGTVVRAVGVYEWTGDLAKPTGTRFVPVTIFIDGELRDAGVYKPQPIPFALLSGNIYELEDSGLPKGTVTLETALHAVEVDGAPAPPFIAGWTAYGNYKGEAAPRKAAPLKPAKTLSQIAISGGNGSKPHLDDKSSSSPAKSGDTSQDGTSAKTDNKGNSDSGDSGRPTLHRKTTDSSTGSSGQTTGNTSGSDQSGGTDASKTSGTKTDKTSDSSSQTASKPASTDDDADRPTMHRRSVSDDNASSDSSKTASSEASDDDAERPTLRRRSPEDNKKRKNEKESASVTGGVSPDDDPDRPRLHHGGNSDDTEAPKLTGVPANMRQMVAISDAKDRDTHVFARPWEDTNEHTAVLAKMQAFARAKLAEYGVVPGVTPVTAVAGTTAPATAAKGATVNPNDAPDTGPPALKRGMPSKAQLAAESGAAASGTASSPATKSQTTQSGQDQGPPTLKRGVPPKSTTATAGATATTSTAGKKTAAARAKTRKPATPVLVTLADEDLRGYTLSYGGSPTYVYMAHTVETGSVMRYVTIVAQDNGMGELKVALASATDAAHLDRTPWMRLVDVVDVEASNRASLLFELRGQSSRQFGLYRVIAAKPEQIFLSGS
jgi:hypothetical protein